MLRGSYNIIVYAYSGGASVDLDVSDEVFSENY